MKIAFFTLGCKVNQYESQAMGERMVKCGFELVSPNKKADVYVINSCTVLAISFWNSAVIFCWVPLRERYCFFPES